MQSLRLTLRHYQVEALVFGEPNATPILALHGWLDNAASFIPLTQQLQAYLPNYQLICIDWPGHGQSDHKSNGAYYHFIDWVDDLNQIVDALSITSAHIIGHSMGGMIASAFSAVYPEKVRSLTLIDAFGFVVTDASETVNQLKKGLESRQKNNPRKLRIFESVQQAAQARVRVSDMQYQDALLIAERGLKTTPLGYQWQSDSKLNLTSLFRFSPEQAQNVVASLAIPCQIICGTKGAEVIGDMLKRYQRLDIPLFELLGGHHIHMEKPSEAMALLAPFIKSNS